MAIYLGIDLGGTSVKGGRVDEAGLLQKEELVLSQEGSSDEVFEEICELIALLWNDNIEGIGFAVPALIDMSEGSMYGLSNLKQLDGFQIRARLSERFGVPVLLQNDANCFVLGEKHYGSARGFQDVVGLITGTGVGAGLIIKNHLYHGMNFGAGEFGMIPFKDTCFEDYCGGKFFTEKYFMSGEKLAVLAQKGDSVALEAFSMYGQHLGELIKLICYALDPQIITLGGSVSKSYELYKEALEQTLESFYFTNNSKAKIITAALSEAAMYGAASLFYEGDPGATSGQL